MSKRKTLLILICFFAFVSLGLPDGLLGVAWPYLHLHYGAPLDSLGLLLVFFSIGYLLSSFNSGKIMAKVSLGTLLAVSCAVTGLSLLGFAFGSLWFVLLGMALLLGAGGGAIDASINTFAAHNFSTGTVNWLHAFYGIGATLGPVIMTAYLVNDFSWSAGYLTVGGIQLMLAFVFLFTLPLWKTQEEQHEPVAHARSGDTLRLPVTWLSMLVFFLYTGTEVSLGQWLFTILTRARDTSEAAAGFWTSVYWGSLTAGRIFFGIVLRRVSASRVMLVCMIVLLAGTGLIAMNVSSVITLSGIMMAGFALAPVFPTLIAMTPRRVGKPHAGNAVGFQVSAAISGGALLPGLAGLMIDVFGIAFIPVLHVAEAALLLCFYLWLAGSYRVES